MKILTEVIKDIVAGCLCQVLNVMAAVVVSLTCAVGLYGGNDLFTYLQHLHRKPTHKSNPSFLRQHLLYS